MTSPVPGSPPAPPSDEAKPPLGGRRLALILSLVGFAIVAVIAGVAMSSSSKEPPSGPSSVTDPARFDVPTIDGTGRVRLADFKGKPLVVNFFASWCGPCQKELPDFAVAARTLAGKVAFVAVDSKEISTSAGIALARNTGLAEAGVTLARDVGTGGSALHDSYEVRNAMPVNAFYDAGGKLLYVAPGQLTPEKLSTQLQQLFGITL
jgi:cytochrome c biogenesis protein CcmG/thiol:disulfide interchange protein DsbE